MAMVPGHGAFFDSAEKAVAHDKLIAFAPLVDKASNFGKIMAAIGVMSCASLLLELALTRLFSVVLFYHFAFFAISVALLGLGSGGVFAHIRQEWLARCQG